MARPSMLPPQLASTHGIMTRARAVTHLGLAKLSENLALPLDILAGPSFFLVKSLE